MELGELWRLPGKSSSRQLAIVGRCPHRTDRLDRSIVTRSPETIELIAENLLIVGDIVSDDDICTIEYFHDDIDRVLDIWNICNITIIYTIHLRGSEWYRHSRLNEDIVSLDLVNCAITRELRHYSRELDDIGLLFELAVLHWESSRLSIPHADFHIVVLLLETKISQKQEVRGSKNISK